MGPGRARLVVALAASLALAGGALTAAPAVGAAAGAARGPDVVEVYTGLLPPSQVARLRAAGLDHEDIASSGVVGTGRAARVEVEVTTNAATVAALAADGVRLRVKKVKGRTSLQQAAVAAADGPSVFRPYSGPGGLEQELRAITAAHPRTTKLVELGRSVEGKPILAVKVTKQATRVPDGTRPATAFISAQHAREWITPEMTRRLLRHVLAGYGADHELTRLVDTTELWFVPVSNPDGYDHTFTPNGRNWRKNRRPNADGTIGVDPNRNFPVHWGYDNEGSSPETTSDVYRGPSAASEPETRAMTGLMARVRPEFLVNYHSAAELLLYGAGFQVATPTPDDQVYAAMAGDDATPAVPGYDPDISAELYTTNGDTNDTAHNAYGVLSFTPEMSTCETVSDRYPVDRWRAEDCASVFTFPDDEALVQEEFLKNVPFALATARSALSPDEPVSVVGRTVPDFVVDDFNVSYGDPQTVAVTARRSLTDLRLNYRVAGGPARSQKVSEWTGGEVYGDENDVYFAEYRGVVTGAEPGQQVEVWFSGVKRSKGSIESDRFTYTLVSDSGDPVLVLADEDYSGVAPTYPTGLEYLLQHQQALTDANYASDVWDTDAGKTGDGVPHPLGVLSHYAAVVWYTGANRLTADPEDFLTTTPFGDFPLVSVAERQQYLTMAVRDYMNEGGKVVVDGELAQYYGEFSFLGGVYFGLNGDETADCVITQPSGLFNECLILADDFSQYWLGAGNRTTAGEATAFARTGDPLGGTFALGTAVPSIRSLRDNGLDEAGAFTVTSDELPVAQFPQFESWKAGDYVGEGGRKPFGPYLGQQYAAALHVDDSYQRLARTADLAGVTAASLDFAMSHNTEGGYDHVIVEAHTVGQDDWTTLPVRGGVQSSSEVPLECEAGFLLEEHPFLTRYLTGGTTCAPSGTSGTWNSLTGSSGGWQELSADLSGFAGKQVEVVITYVTDPGTGGVGVFVDEVGLVLDGKAQLKEGFEGGAGAFTVPGPPAGSPGNTSDWVFAGELVDVAAAVATPRSLLLGFGLEHVTEPAQRSELVRQALARLID